MCYLVIFFIVYLLMAVSNICRLVNDLFDTNEFSLGAYFVEDFFSIGYLVWIHHINFSGSNQREGQPETHIDGSDTSTVNLTDLYLRDTKDRALCAGTSSESECRSGMEITTNPKTN